MNGLKLLTCFENSLQHSLIIHPNQPVRMQSCYKLIVCHMHKLIVCDHIRLCRNFLDAGYWNRNLDLFYLRLGSATSKQ